MAMGQSLTPSHPQPPKPAETETEIERELERMEEKLTGSERSVLAHYEEW